MPTLDDFVPSLPLDDRRINVDLTTRRFAARIASWDDVHSGHDQRVRMPRTVNVDAAHVGTADLDDGASIRVATLPMHTTHAGADLSALHAAMWYENTGSGVARVRYSIDDEGIRADGVLYDDVTTEQIERLTASAPSGDWRAASLVRAPQDYEHAVADFAGACIVNVPGFSGTFAKEARTPLRLVASASGIIAFEENVIVADENETPETPEGCDGACVPCSCGRSGEAQGGDEQEGDALTASAVESPIEYDMEAVFKRIEALEELIATIALSM